MFSSDLWIMGCLPIATSRPFLNGFFFFKSLYFSFAMTSVPVLIGFLMFRMMLSGELDGFMCGFSIKLLLFIMVWLSLFKMIFNVVSYLLSSFFPMQHWGNDHLLCATGQVVVDTSLPLRNKNYCRITSVNPVAVSTSKKAMFSVKGINLTQPTTR